MAKSLAGHGKLRSPMPRFPDRLRRFGIDPHVLRGAGTFFLIYGAGVGITLITQVLLARGLGSARYGEYSWVFRVLTLLMIAARLGLDAGALRFVASFAATADHARLAGYIRTSARLVLASAGVIGVAMVGVAFLAGPRWTPALRACFIAAAIAMPCLVLLQLLTCILRGLSSVLPALIPSALVMPLLFAAGVVIAGDTGTLTPASAMLINAGAAAIALLLSLRGLARVTPKRPAGADVVSESRAWLEVSVRFMIINALTNVVARVDVVWLGVFAASAEVGHYTAAAQLTLVIPFALRAIESWAAPIMAGHHARGERHEVIAIGRRAVALNLAFTLPVSALVIAAGNPLLRLFGPGFDSAYVVLVILTVGQLADALAGPVSVVLSMTGHQNALARVLTVHAMLAVLLGALCAHSWGMPGAAIAISAVRLSYRTTLSWIARRVARA